MKNVHRVIKLDQNTSLKPYIDMNTDMRKKKQKKKKLMNNAVFGKSYGKCGKN